MNFYWTNILNFNWIFYWRIYWLLIEGNIEFLLKFKLYFHVLIFWDWNFWKYWNLSILNLVFNTILHTNILGMKPIFIEELLIFYWRDIEYSLDKLLNFYWTFLDFILYVRLAVFFIALAINSVALNMWVLNLILIRLNMREGEGKLGCRMWRGCRILPQKCNFLHSIDFFIKYRELHSLD